MIILGIRIYLNKLWNYAVYRWPLRRTHTALKECIFLAEQFEHHWKKKVVDILSPQWGGGVGAGGGTWWKCEVQGSPAVWGSHPLFHLGQLLFLSSLPCVLVGKPSSFFPEDSFIDSGEIDVGRRASQKIPPGTFWRSQVFIDHPVHLKFNVSLGKAALVGIYGRKGLPPSHTQVTRTPCPLPIRRGCYLIS